MWFHRHVPSQAFVIRTSCVMDDSAFVIEDNEHLITPCAVASDIGWRSRREAAIVVPYYLSRLN